MGSRGIVITFYLFIVFLTTFERCNAAEETQTLDIEQGAKTTQGGVYDCVNIHKQPAFQHPALKDHQLQMEPSEQLREILKGIPSKKRELEMVAAHEGMLKEEPCPSGTVPIRRRINPNPNHSLQQQQQQEQQLLAPSGFSQYSQSLAAADSGAESAGIQSNAGKDELYLGAVAEMAVFNPIVPKPRELSRAMIVIGQPDQLEQIQVGWMVNPDLYGDKATHLYAGWMSKTSGCYDTRCPGFVVIDNRSVLGSILKPSTVGRNIVGIKLSVVQDPISMNWWLVIGEDKDIIGYWPRSLFSSLQDGAKMAFFGGEVYTPPGEEYSPQMGSGAFKVGNYARTCFMRSVLVLSKDNPSASAKLNPPKDSSIIPIESRCYLVGDYSYKPDHGWYSFYFGGKGHVRIFGSCV